MKSTIICPCLLLATLLPLAACGWSPPSPEDVGPDAPAADVRFEATPSELADAAEEVLPDQAGQELPDLQPDLEHGEETCEPKAGSTECDDGNACTQDDCGPSGCTHLPLDGSSCDDADPCTLGDACLGGTCQGLDPACFDGLECTLDFCAADGTCAFPVAAGFCLVGGICIPDGAEGPTSCLSCHADLAKDAWSVVADGTLCTDDDLCTADENCQSGVCLGLPVPCDDGLWCTKDECDPQSGGCAFAQMPGTCLIESVCWPDGSTPAGPAGQCRRCDSATDPLGWTSEPDGTLCEDFSACSPVSACLQGECASTGSLCDDGNPCTDDLCMDEQCSHVAVANEAPCPDDGFPCTGDRCIEGLCSHPVDSGCFLEGQCVAEGKKHPIVPCLACLHAKSDLAWSALPPGTACEDGLFCTTDDFCADGQCHGLPLACPGNACATGKCREDIDQCELAPSGDGAPCDDADPCTMADACMGGTCAGAAKDCSGAAAGNTCLKSWCAPAGTADAGKCLTAPLVAGTACEDGFTCTLGSVCEPGGVCGSGTPVTAEECFAAQGKGQACKVGHCMEPLGCLLVDGPDGVFCSILHGKGTCLSGACKILSCSAGYKDCNKVVSDGCETLLSTSSANCGACGKSCELPSAISACVLGGCVVSACLGGALDCNGLPVDGCEVDPQSSPSNCGKCGASCLGNDPWQVGACDKAVCSSSACPPGTLNIDGKPDNGCEGMDVLWVDATNGGQPGLEDGSQAYPFDTIGEALLAVQPGQAIYVLPGTYAEGNLEVDKPGTVIAGTGTTEVVLAVPQGSERGFVVHSDEVSIVRLSIHGGRYGIELSGNPMAPIQAGLIEDVALAGQAPNVASPGDDAAGIAVRFADQVEIRGATFADISGVAAAPGCLGPAGTGNPVYGILQQWSNGTRIEDCKVFGVTAGAGGQGGGPGCAEQAPGTGGRSAGIRVENSLQCIIQGNSFTGITGGTGGSADALAPPMAGSGGIAAGIELQDSSLCEVAGNSFAVVTGGAGGMGGTPAKIAGTGGIAAGIGLQTSENNWLHDNSFGVVKGGASLLLSGEKEADATQVGYAIHLGSGAENNLVDPSNHIGIAPIVYLYGVDGHSLLGLNVQTEGYINPTNFGAITVVASANILISGNTVSSVRGERGASSSGAGHPGKAGGPAVGIRVQDCVGCEVFGNDVSNIAGGAAGFPEPGGAGLPGGHAWGILMEGDQTCAIRDNEVRTVTGGPASAGEPGGTGGDVSAIAVGAGFDLLIQGNSIRSLFGGKGGGTGDSVGPGGDAVGLSLSALGEPVTVANNEVSAIDGGTGNAAGDSSCVSFDATTNITVSHLTCAQVGQTAGTGNGVVLAEKGAGSIKVTNSIFALVSGFGLWNHSANPVPALKSFYCDFWKCGAGEVNHASKDNTLLIDPQFADLLKGNLTILPASGCIDAGDPTNTCVDEPAPNGCRVNIGAYGNTPKATPKSGASHCANCPQK